MKITQLPFFNKLNSLPQSALQGLVTFGKWVCSPVISLGKYIIDACQKPEGKELLSRKITLGMLKCPLTREQLGVLANSQDKKMSMRFNRVAEKVTASPKNNAALTITLKDLLESLEIPVNDTMTLEHIRDLCEQERVDNTFFGAAVKTDGSCASDLKKQEQLQQSHDVYEQLLDSIIKHCGGKARHLR